MDPSAAWPESPAAGGTVLVEGSTFAVCQPGGDMVPGSADGLFVLDSRVVSEWRLLLGGHRLEPLRGFTEEPFAGVFVLREAPGRAAPGEPTVVVERRRYVGAGMREDLEVTNHSRRRVQLRLELRVAADFADVFAVKRGNARPPGEVTVEADGGRWRSRVQLAGHQRVTTVHSAGGQAAAGGLQFRLSLPPGGRWAAQVECGVEVDGRRLRPRFPAGVPVERAEPVRRAAAWRAERAWVSSESAVLETVLARSQRDLGALRMDSDGGALGVLAAGAPWFMALFGRDSLLSSWMTLALDPGIAVGTLQALAASQGRRVDPVTEEQPGRIVHELRRGTEISLALGGAQRYYGSVDATPLFVVLLADALRWGVERDVVRQLLPAADAALEWVERYGDRDGDGFVEYATSSPSGLRNQGWKDSDDGINFADGRLAEPPIALVEVQGYVYAAYRARAYLAGVLEGAGADEPWSEAAIALKERFNRAFWLADAGYFALGLDGEKRPIDALTSNIGHALWSGVVADRFARSTAERLLSPELFTGYGIRTLAEGMGAYNPVSYHNGSVWPHDTAITVAALARWGFPAQAQQVAIGLIDAAASFTGRLPEVFCGFARDAVPGPVPYPTSCSPQAWAAAAPVSVVTSLLGVRPDVPAGSLELRPTVPVGWRPLELPRARLGPGRLQVAVGRSGRVDLNLPAGLRCRQPEPIEGDQR